MATDARDGIAIAQAQMSAPSREPSVVFVDRHINDVHPKFQQLQPRYSAEDGKFIEPGDQSMIPIQETGEMRRQKELFLSGVKKFEKSSKGSKTRLKLDKKSEYG